MQTWLSLYFPCFSVEIFTRGEAAIAPLAVTEGQGQHRRIFQANGVAHQAGVHCGMKTGAALAIAPQITLRERDERRERRALQQLAVWAQQFTSHVSLNFPHCVLLEVAGSQKLFGGFENLLSRIVSDLNELGYTAQHAATTTPLGGYWLARCKAPNSPEKEKSPNKKPHKAEVPSKEQLFMMHNISALAALPLSRLDITRTIIDGLTKLGIHNLGQCFALPRDGVVNRFGKEFLQRLDQARGLHPDPQPIFTPPQHFYSELLLPAEVHEHEALFFGVNRLIMELCAFLTSRELGIQRFCLELAHARLTSTTLTIGVNKATRRKEHLLLVTREYLQQLTLPAPVECIRLHSKELKPLALQNRNLFDQHDSASMTPDEFVERLCSRLGDSAVHGVWRVAEHRPEYAWCRTMPCDVTNEQRVTAPCAQRPLWLLPSPKPLPAQFANTLLLKGMPERIESGWWDGEDIARDYFIALADTGETFWVYRDRRAAGAWFIHGIFG